MTYKVGNGLERLEFEDKLFSARKFVAKMSKETGKKAIKKERFTVYMDGQKPVEISIVDDTWAYAEVEFESIAEAKKYKFPWPEMIATEVTGVPKYSMAGYWANTRENRQI